MRIIDNAYALSLHRAYIIMMELIPDHTFEQIFGHMYITNKYYDEHNEYYSKL